MQSAASIDSEIDVDSFSSRRQQINIQISKHTTIDRRSRRRIHRRPGAIGIDNGGVDDGTAGTVAECVRGKGSSGSVPSISMPPRLLHAATKVSEEHAGGVSIIARS